MNSLQNLPILLCYEEDGSIVAHCPLLPDCTCRSTSRSQVLRTMQQLIAHTLKSTAVAAVAPKAQKYEVVHLAVSHASDSVNLFSKRSSRPKPERARLEVM